jgi:hypothetical protein
VLPPVLSDRRFYRPRLSGFEDECPVRGVRKACSDAVDDLDPCPAFLSLFERLRLSKNDGNASGSSPRSNATQIDSTSACSRASEPRGETTSSVRSPRDCAMRIARWWRRKRDEIRSTSASRSVRARVCSPAQAPSHERSVWCMLYRSQRRRGQQRCWRAPSTTLAAALGAAPGAPHGLRQTQP